MQRREFREHPKWPAHEDLLRGRHRLVQEGLEHVATGAVLRRFNALQSVHQRNQSIECYSLKKCVIQRGCAYHFEVALNLGRVVGTQTELAVNIQLAHVGIVFTDL